MSDSEPKVNAAPPQSGVYDSEPKRRSGAKVSNMRENRDPVLTDFVKMKIAEWQASGREIGEIAQIAGFSKSIPSQVKRDGMGVGAKTAPGFAKAFGFSNVAAMVDAAYEWRKTSGAALDELLAEEPVQRAIEAVKTFVVGSTDVSLRAILSAFVHPRFRGRDYDFWWQELGREARRDADEAVAHRTELGDRRREKDAATRKEESAWRTAARVKNQVAEAKAELVRREAAAEADVEKHKKRRKIRAV